MCTNRPSLSLKNEISRNIVGVMEIVPVYRSIISLHYLFVIKMEKFPINIFKIQPLNERQLCTVSFGLTFEVINSSLLIKIL